MELIKAGCETVRKGTRSARPLATIGAAGYPFLSVLALLLAWEMATRLWAIPRFLLPRPSEIVVEMMQKRAILLQHSLDTLLEIGGGFLAGMAIGMPLAVLLAYSERLERATYPLLVIFQTVPKIALAPLFITWLGFGYTPKVAVAFLIAFFPIVIDTVVGLKSTPPEMIYLARSNGASPWRMFRLIRFPSALPNIFAGLKVAITLAVVGAVVGEFVGADRGLGYLIQVSSGNLDTVLLFASIAVLSIMGVSLFFLVDFVERLMLSWHVSRRSEG